MAFYAKAECDGAAPGQQAVLSLTADSQMRLETTNTLATSCLKMFCQLWQTCNQRIDLKQLLLKNGFLLQDDLKNIFLAPLVAALRLLNGLQRQPRGSRPEG